MFSINCWYCGEKLSNPEATNDPQFCNFSCEDAYKHSKQKPVYAHWNSKKTHCKHGHPFDENNTYIKPNGERGCRTCRNRLARIATLKKKENRENR